MREKEREGRIGVRGREGTMDLTAGRCKPVCRIFQPPHSQLKELRTHWFLNSRKYLNGSIARREKEREGG